MCKNKKIFKKTDCIYRIRSNLLKKMNIMCKKSNDFFNWESTVLRLGVQVTLDCV